MAFTSRRNGYKGLTGGYSMNPSQMDEASSQYTTSASSVVAGIADFESEIIKAASNIEGDSFETMKKSMSTFKTVIENFESFSREMAGIIDERKQASLAHDTKYANSMDISNISNQ